MYKVVSIFLCSNALEKAQLGCGTKMHTGKHHLSIVERLNTIMVTLGLISGMSINFDGHGHVNLSLFLSLYVQTLFY